MAVGSGDLIFLSGHGCFDNATPIHVGKLGADLTTEQGRQAARAVALNLLATTIDQVGELSRVAQVVKMVVFVNSTPDFTEQHLVANGATDLLIEVLGEAGEPPGLQGCIPATRLRRRGRGCGTPDAERSPDD
jgi:enamine deaminase RidA (YjgF/YER057c/UK114 family)